MLHGKASSNHESIEPIAAFCATLLAVMDYGFDPDPTVGFNGDTRLIISQVYRYLLIGNVGIHVTEGRVLSLE